MTYRLHDKDVTFAFTPEAIRKSWQFMYDTDISVDDETLRSAAHEIMLTQYPELVGQIVQLAKEYSDAVALQRTLQEEWLASPDADP